MAGYSESKEGQWQRRSGCVKYVSAPPPAPLHTPFHSQRSSALKYRSEYEDVSLCNFKSDAPERDGNPSCAHAKEILFAIKPWPGSSQ